MRRATIDNPVALATSQPNYAPATSSALASLAALFPANFAAFSVNTSGRVVLQPSGLDSIPVEAGINARQALSPILAAASGTITGNGTSTVLVKAPTTAQPTRVTATMSGLDRVATTLSLPS